MHLELVLIIVLLLQSFLAFSLCVHNCCQLCVLCDNLVLALSVCLNCIWTTNSTWLTLTMAEAMYMYSLDLMVIYCSVTMTVQCTECPMTFFDYWFSFKQSSGVFNRDCTKTVYLYSSQYESLSRDTVLWSYEGT